MLGGLCWYGPPLERETTFTSEHVFGRAATNQTNVQRGERWVEYGVLVLPQLYGDGFQSIDQPRRAKNGRRAEGRISAVCFASFHDHFGERVAFARANWFERSGLADDAVTHTQRLHLG